MYYFSPDGTANAHNPPHASLPLTNEIDDWEAVARFHFYTDCRDTRRHLHHFDSGSEIDLNSLSGEAETASSRCTTDSAQTDKAHTADKPLASGP